MREQLPTSPWTGKSRTVQEQLPKDAAVERNVCQLSDFKQHNDRNDRADQQQGTCLDHGIQTAVPASSTFPEFFHKDSPTRKYTRIIISYLVCSILLMFYATSQVSCQGTAVSDDTKFHWGENRHRWVVLKSTEIHTPTETIPRWMAPLGGSIRPIARGFSAGHPAPAAPVLYRIDHRNRIMVKI